jgi:hypothetical protein
MKTTNKRERMYADIQKHGENLNVIFNTGIDPVKLCKKLHTLEAKAHRLATDYCNGENGVNSENWEAKITPIMDKVYTILNNGSYNEDRPHQKKAPIFLNGDARGYALKINDSYVKANNLKLHTDMGGYGILSPEFTGQ